MLAVIESHLESRQVGRVIYGAIIGLALVVALEKHPPSAGVMAASLAGTGLAVGMAELYSEIVGTEVRRRRKLTRAELGSIGTDVAAVAVGVSFPAVFFLLSVTDVMDLDTAFDFAKWSGLALIGFYGYCAGRLAGSSVLGSLTQAAAVALIGGFLIAFKALIH